MGNLVTIALDLTGPAPDLILTLGRLTGEDPTELMSRVRVKGGPVWAGAAPWRAAPEPDVVTATGDGHQVDLGLAVLSRDGTDHLRLKQGLDPFLAQMPPEFSETADGLLRKHGVAGLTGEALLAAAETRAPGCVDAGRRAIAAYEATGEFGWYDWRMRHWGARAFGAELRVTALPDGAISVRFDSVNSCPVALIRALLAQAPGVEMCGAALDEDAGTAVLLVTDGAELLVTETEEEGDLSRAYELIYGRARETDEPEDEGPEEDGADEDDPEP